MGTLAFAEGEDIELRQMLRSSRWAEPGLPVGIAVGV